MKRLFITLFLAGFLCTVAHSQEIYTQIRSKAKAALRDPNTPPMQRQFNQFKADALDYMVMKMKEKMPDSSAVVLDRQALALNEFLTLYIQTITRHKQDPPALLSKYIKLFMDISVGKPLFNDNESDITHCYYVDENNLTRFSLDTNWQIAVLAVRIELKKIK